jgi:GNAT superfamily N-acetyltransferase
MSVTYRPGTEAENYRAFQIFLTTISDFSRRMGFSSGPETDPSESEKTVWQQREALFAHLERSFFQFWVAVEDEQIVGYARSILRDGLMDLTEFFVMPGRQAAGIGRELLARAFPAETAAQRVIIATNEVRALARYLKTGVYARFPIYNFSRPPRMVDLPPGLTASPLRDAAEDIEALRQVDQAVLGHTRDLDHLWWMRQRPGYLYWREGTLVGYGYSSLDGGPFALVDDVLYPAVLAHAEREAAAQGVERFHLEVPLINHAAVDYLLAQGYEMNSFLALFMSSEPFGRFENYIFPSPPFTI